MTIWGRRASLVWLSGLAAIVGFSVFWWTRLTPAERWVAWHGWQARDDLFALTQGQVRDLGWPLIDSTIVISGSGYAVVALHDEVQTGLLFAATPAGRLAFTETVNGQIVRPIRGPWYEISLR